MPKFCDLIEATALDGIEKDLKINIDRKHIKRLKQPYKGNPHPTVIRKRTDKVPVGDKLNFFKNISSLEDSRTNWPTESSLSPFTRR